MYLLHKIMTIRFQKSVTGELDYFNDKRTLNPLSPSVKNYKFSLLLSIRFLIVLVGRIGHFHYGIISLQLP